MRKEEFNKKETEKKVQTKITDNLKRLPYNERELFLREEEKRKRAELKEVRENLWRKWRGAGEGKMMERKSNIEEMNDQLRRLEDKTEEWKKQEERRKRTREKREKEMEDIREEKKKRQLQNDIRNEEKKMRKET